MQPRHWTIALAALLAVAAGAWLYKNEHNNLKASARNTFEVRADLLRQHIRLMRHNVYALERQIEHSYQAAARGAPPAVELDAIRYYPEHEVWGISGLAEEGGLAELSGTLTGFDSLAEPTAEVHTELSAVLGADHLFSTLLEHVPDIIWVYYTSKRDFIYIAPDPAIADFRFSHVLYEKEFWAQARPAANPTQRQIISDLYRDAYGQGLMISISSPVRIDGDFRGVASLDLGIDLLQELTAVGTAAGESLLVDEKDQIVARPGEFDLSETYAVAHSGDWMQHDDANWLSARLVEEELRLLHRLPDARLHAAAARASAMEWAVLAAMFGLVVFSVRLNNALGTVRTLMKRDALTQLLNRRGLADAAVEARKQAQRQGADTAVLLLDLDHFKWVNDNHGHDFGDRVLTELAARLSASVGAEDLVCRWGGEEVVLLFVYGEAANLARIGERLRATVSDHPFQDGALELTVSGGLTDWHEGEALQAAIDRADRLLYCAKQNGRNRIETDLAGNDRPS
jgi:diguanylate cyclase (GGDEF)-like protein